MLSWDERRSGSFGNWDHFPVARSKLEAVSLDQRSCFSVLGLRAAMPPMRSTFPGSASNDAPWAGSSLPYEVHCVSPAFQP